MFMRCSHARPECQTRKSLLGTGILVPAFCFVSRTPFICAIPILYLARPRRPAPDAWSCLNLLITAGYLKLGTGGLVRTEWISSWRDECEGRTWPGLVCIIHNAL